MNSLCSNSRTIQAPNYTTPENPELNRTTGDSNNRDAPSFLDRIPGTTISNSQ